MGDTFITDMTHFLDEFGELPDLPTRVLNLVLHQGAIVEWMTAIRPQGHEWTNVYCRRSPGRKRCAGQIIAHLDSDSDAISWECLYCGDGGHIYGWAGTIWDRTRDSSL